MIPQLPFDPSLLLIPLISGLIGYITNWFGIKMLFYPIEHVGFRVPGLKRLVVKLPDRVQQIPGLLRGRVGWQGIIPARADKMASISVDTGISKLASQREFYETFDPDRIAQHILASSSDEIHELVDEVIREEHPDLWGNMPEPVYELVHRRVDARLPKVVDTITDEIGENIDELLDVKTMVIRNMKRNPELINRLFFEAGDRELRFVINSGFLIGGFLGLFTIPLFLAIGSQWVLPVVGATVGYVTNWIALKVIFNPVEEKRIGPFELQGLFIKRQPEVALAYGREVAENTITLENIAEDMLHGRKSDRTRRMLRDMLRPEVDRAMGVAAPAVRVTTGRDEYEAIRDRMATEAAELSIEPMSDPEFNEDRAEAIEELIATRLAEMPPDQYVETLRTAFEEDEWMLIGLGAVLGFVAGWIQLAVVTAA
jgi:uncharacterized membrane protein YheB (UPF0754 family)